MKQVLLLTFALSVAQPHALFSQWGVEAGASYNIQDGSFRAPCGCIFQSGNGIWNGKGVGFLGAVSYDILSLNEFTIGVEPGFDLKAVTDYEVPSNPLSGDQINVQMSYITLGPYMRYQIHGSGLFIQIEPEADYLLSNSYQHTSKPIPDPSADKDSSMGDLRSMRYAARGSIGYKFAWFGLELAPMLSINVPLNNIRANVSLDPVTDTGIHGANGWHVTSIYVTLSAFFKS